MIFIKSKMCKEDNEEPEKIVSITEEELWYEIQKKEREEYDEKR
jgi:hypothetical protein